MYTRYPIILDGAQPYDLGAHILASLRQHKDAASPAPRRMRASDNRPRDTTLPRIPGIIWHSGKWVAKSGTMSKRFGSTVEAFWKAVAWKEEHV